MSEREKERQRQRDREVNWGGDLNLNCVLAAKVNSTVLNQGIPKNTTNIKTEEEDKPAA